MILRAENLLKKYKSRSVVDHVSFEVSQGEIVGLLGPNGAGKTTSFYMVVGLVKPDEGEVFLDNENIPNCLFSNRPRLELATFPKKPSFSPNLSFQAIIPAFL